MEVGAQQAAEWLGVSQRRVQALARAGRLPARQVAGVWLIETTGLAGIRRRSRPMSARVARAMVDLISDPRASASTLGLADREASRLRSRLVALRADDDPGSLLASWLAADGTETIMLSAHPADLLALLADPRVTPTGISDPRANLSIRDEAQAWVHRDDLDAVTGEHMLAPTGQPNVRLHLTDQHPPAPVPFGRLLADLLVHPGPRERAAVHRLLREHSPQPEV